ncbi:MAG: tetratricopeptide repeat protein [Candidatus Thorarchaeota archaeon]
MVEIEVDPITQGRYYIKKHEFKRAEEEFLKAIENDSKNVEALWLTSQCRRNLYRMEEALDAASKAVQYGPENPDALYELTQVYRAMGDPENALKIAKKMNSIPACQKVFDTEKLISIIQNNIKK